MDFKYINICTGNLFAFNVVYRLNKIYQYEKIIYCTVKRINGRNESGCFVCIFVYLSCVIVYKMLFTGLTNENSIHQERIKWYYSRTFKLDLRSELPRCLINFWDPVHINENYFGGEELIRRDPFRPLGWIWKYFRQESSN